MSFSNASLPTILQLQITCDIFIKNEVAEHPLLLSDALVALRKITDLFQMQGIVVLNIFCVYFVSRNILRYSVV